MRYVLKFYDGKRSTTTVVNSIDEAKKMIDESIEYYNASQPGEPFMSISLEPVINYKEGPRQ